MLTPYDTKTEQKMIKFFESLSEKDKRRYSAIEVLKLPYGGRSYIVNLFGCHFQTIEKGINELYQKRIPLADEIRHCGGGRKRLIETISGIDDLFLKVLKDFTAGDPMKDKVKWTHLTFTEIIDSMCAEGICISKSIVKQLLKKHGFVKRKAQKNIALGKSENRNEQFEKISSLKQKYKKSGNPVISIDTKKKELIGNLYRDGHLYTREVINVYDHDFPYLSEGTIIPHGIYDIQKNTAFINLGTSHDTSEFARDSINRWWNYRGRHDYKEATSLLILADCGGSNGYRHYVFKKAILELSNKLGIEIRIAHYPAYTSKWNPIEHRLFPHVTRALQGVILKSIDLVKTLVERTKTKTGLKVVVHIINKFYPIGKKISKSEKEKIKTSIVHDEFLGHWNYKALPSAYSV